VRQRHYDLPTARWMSQDPLRGFDLIMSVYHYCNDQPTRCADPSGAVPVAIPVVVGGVTITEAVAATFGLSVAACLVHPPCLKAVNDALLKAAQDAAQASARAAERASRCLCKRRHPLYPICPIVLDWEPSDAIDAVGAIGPGFSRPLLAAPCEAKGPAVPGPRCRGGGTRYNCYVNIIDKFNIRHKRTIGVFCCNCCHRFTTGIYCYTRTPLWAAGQGDPVPGNPEK
jgi:hypothetical protein